MTVRKQGRSVCLGWALCFFGAWVFSSLKQSTIAQHVANTDVQHAVSAVEVGEDPSVYKPRDYHG